MAHPWTFALLTVLMLFINLPTGPRFGRVVLVSQIYAIALAAIMLFSSQQRAPKLSIGFIGALLGSLMILSLGILGSSESIWAVIQALRKMMIIPGVFLVLGYVAIQRGFYFATIPCALSGLMALVLMLLSIRHTPAGVQIEGVGWTGEQSRVFFSYLERTVWFRGPGVLTQCFAAGMCVVFLFLTTNRLYRWGLGAIMASYVFLGIYVGTRTGTILILMAFFGVILVNLFSARKATRAVLLILAFLVSVPVGGLAFYAAYQISPERVQRFLPENLFDTTAAGRTDIWIDRFQSIAENPSGVGLQAAVDYSMKSSHNMYIESFLAFGIIGGIGFTLFWVVIGVRFAVLFFKDYRNPVITCSAAFVALALLYGCIESLFISSYVMYQLIFYGLGVFAFLSSVRRRTVF